VQLSIIIVNHNVKYFLEQCLCSVLKACAQLQAEIFVVDNQSTDGSRSFLENRFNSVRFIWSDVNEGFAKANNRAVALAKGRYVLFLNPDTLVPEDCFERCLSFLEARPQAGALGIRMVDGSGQFLKESKRAFPSPLTSFYKLSGLTRLLPRSKTFGRYYLGHLNERENHQVDVLAGAFMLLPMQVLQTVGSFDDTFFMYGEDVDLSYRIQRAGYQNWYLAESTIIHFKGESTKKGSLNYVRLFYRAMSQFVRKHYSGSRAGIFNLSVQAAIWGRAVLSALARFVQRIGLPLVDAGIILASFWATKLWWGAYVRHQVNYSPNMLVIAFPIFTAIFLAASYYAGLYDRGYRQQQLNRATFWAALLLLSGYALLPESLRFSRGILVFGIALAFLGMSLLRWLFVRWGVLKAAAGGGEAPQTVVVANRADFDKVTELMQKAGMGQRVLGRIGTGPEPEAHTLGSLPQLPQLLKRYPVKEVVFCEDGLSFARIIEMVQLLPPGIGNKFHASGSCSIVGSDSKDESGHYVAADKKYPIGSPSGRRIKNLIDVGLAILLLVGLPLHILLQQRPGGFLANLWAVLLRRKTWVGYASGAAGLPAIKKGVLTSTSLPVALNELPPESLLVSDEWYATGYTAYTDLKKIARGFRYLGCRH
jgi:O-antigen biosynthesis protein